MIKNFISSEENDKSKIEEINKKEIKEKVKKN